MHILKGANTCRVAKTVVYGGILKITDFTTLRFYCIICANTSRSGEIGRRSGLKIHRAQPSCRFESGLRYHKALTTIVRALLCYKI